MLDPHHQQIAGSALLFGIGALISAEIIADADAGDLIFSRSRFGKNLSRHEAPKTFRAQILLGRAFAIGMALACLCCTLMLSDLV